MKLYIKDSLIYDKKFDDWDTLEENYTNYLTSQGRAIQTYLYESIAVGLGFFILEQIVQYLKKKREEKNRKELTEKISQKIDQIKSSEIKLDQEQIDGRALLKLVGDGIVTIIPETDLEKDLLDKVRSNLLQETMK
ncbi:MAG: hypothetical protein U9N83_14890 [Thermodesulfobacteriota bacterium]|nr:hypothetical protein [Thermodesulfobacteriota bacterium]